MQSGRYSICLSAGSYAGAGELRFDGREGQGHDGKYRLDLQMHEEGPRGAATIDLLLDPNVIHNAAMPERFSLPVTGSVSDSAFSLIGVGPLGVIVSLSGEMVSEKGPQQRESC